MTFSYSTLSFICMKITNNKIKEIKMKRCECLKRENKLGLSCAKLW